MAETILVTGGTGFVAGWCIVELLRQGFTVRTTVRNLSREQAARTAIATAIDPGDRLTFVTADLTADDGWAAAVAGCDYVLHVASPLGYERVTDEDTFIRPAVDGTLRVLQAAVGAGVKRVVMTSSLAAATPKLSGLDSVSDENFWTDPDDATLIPYRKSKVLAERAAWAFIKAHGSMTELTTILPGAIFGPILSADKPGSVMVIGRMLAGQMPGTPKVGFEVVDVRDLAALHIRAMLAPKASGERFFATGEFLWMGEVAQILRRQLGDAARKVPKYNLPTLLLKLLARFDSTIATIAPQAGRKHLHPAIKAEQLLEWKTRPAAETVIECAKSLLAWRVL